MNTAHTEQPIDEVAAFGSRLFDGRYASVRARLEARIVSGYSTIEPDLAECAELETVVKSSPAVIRDETVAMRLP